MIRWRSTWTKTSRDTSQSNEQWLIVARSCHCNSNTSCTRNNTAYFSCVSINSQFHLYNGCFPCKFKAQKSEPTSYSDIHITLYVYMFHNEVQCHRQDWDSSWKLSQWCCVRFRNRYGSVVLNTHN